MTFPHVDSFYDFVGINGEHLYFRSSGTPKKKGLVPILSSDLNQARLRTGCFDNQGSNKTWTWAWTTDSHDYEVWTPHGLKLMMTEERLFVARKRIIFSEVVELSRSDLLSIELGKTGFASFGILGIDRTGTRHRLIADSYPVMDAMLNVTYDGICEDEDLLPLLMIGREMATRWSIPFEETTR